MPKVTKNDMVQMSGRIPGQLERLERRTPTVYKEAEMLSMPQLGGIQFGSNARTAFAPQSNIASDLLATLRPITGLVEEGRRIRDRVDRERMQDVQLLVGNILQKDDIDYQSKLRMIDQAYAEFKPLTKTSQVAAHNQRTQALQELNGITDDLKFTSWASKTLRESNNYPIVSEGEGLSRQDFLEAATKDFTSANPQLKTSGDRWLQGQISNDLKEQFNRLYDITNTQLDVILNSEGAGRVGLGATAFNNTIRNFLETSLSEAGIDPRNVLDNPGIMEAVDQKVSSFYAAQTTIQNRKARGQNASTLLVNGQLNRTANIHKMSKYTSSVDEDLQAMTQALTLSLSSVGPEAMFTYLYNGVKQVPSIIDRDSAITNTRLLSRYNVLRFPEELQPFVKKVQEEPEYLSTILGEGSEGDRAAYAMAMRAYSSLYRQDFELFFGSNQTTAQLLQATRQAEMTTGPVNPVTVPSSPPPEANREDERIFITREIRNNLYSTQYGDNQKSIIDNILDFRIAVYDFEYQEATSGVGMGKYPQSPMPMELMFPDAKEYMSLRDSIDESLFDDDFDAYTQIARKMVNEGIDIPTPQRFTQQATALSSTVSALSNGVTVNDYQSSSEAMDHLSYTAMSLGEEAFNNISRSVNSTILEDFRLANLEYLNDMAFKGIAAIIEDEDVNALMKFKNIAEILERKGNSEIFEGDQRYVGFVNSFEDSMQRLANKVAFESGGIFSYSDGVFKLSDDNEKVVPYLSSFMESYKEKRQIHGYSLDFPKGVQQELNKRMNGLREEIEQARREGELNNWMQSNLPKVAPIFGLVSGNGISFLPEETVEKSSDLLASILGIPASNFKSSRPRNARAFEATPDRVIDIRNFALRNSRALLGNRPEDINNYARVIQGYQGLIFEDTQIPSRAIFDRRIVFENSNIGNDVNDVLNMDRVTGLPRSNEEEIIKNREKGRVATEELMAEMTRAGFDDPQVFNFSMETGELYKSMKATLEAEGRKTSEFSADALLTQSLNAAGKRVVVSIVEVDNEDDSKPGLTAYMEEKDELYDGRFFTYSVKVMPASKDPVADGFSSPFEFNPFTEQGEFLSRIENELEINDPLAQAEIVSQSETIVPYDTFKLLNSQFKQLQGVSGNWPEVLRRLVNHNGLNRGLSHAREGDQDSYEYGISELGLNQGIAFYMQLQQISQLPNSELNTEKFIKNMLDYTDATDTKGIPKLFAAVLGTGLDTTIETNFGEGLGFGQEQEYMLDEKYFLQIKENILRNSNRNFSDKIFEPANWQYNLDMIPLLYSAQERKNIKEALKRVRETTEQIRIYN